MLSFEDFVEQTQQAKTVRQLQMRFQRAMLDEGYENTIFCRISLGKLEDVAWQKFPDGYLKTYAELGWERIDPILGYSLRSVRPFRWSEVVHDLHLTRRQLEFLKETVRMGVPTVNVVPFSSPNGGRELIAFGERKAKRADPARRPVLQAMCTQVWSRHGELVGGRDAVAGDGPRLTQKELEILRWTKHGKSNAEIAEIQGLSVKTIEYHVGNILKKLGATNRITAVVKAIRDGLLPL